MKFRRMMVIVGVLLIVTLAIGLEWAFRYGGSASGCAQVVNEGDEPMEGLAARYKGTVVNLGRLGPGQKAKVWFSGAGRAPISFEFTQNGNPMKGFDVDDFDPMEHRRDGSKLVLIVKPNRIERFVEADESNKTPTTLLERLADWIRDELH